MTNVVYITFLCSNEILSIFIFSSIKIVQTTFKQQNRFCFLNERETEDENFQFKRSMQFDTVNMIVVGSMPPVSNKNKIFNFVVYFPSRCISYIARRNCTQKEPSNKTLRTRHCVLSDGTQHHAFAFFLYFIFRVEKLK